MVQGSVRLPMSLYLAFFLITVTAGCSSFFYKEKPLDKCTKKRLKDNPTKEDKDFKNLGPALFVQNFIGTVEPKLEQYVFLQLQLEDIAEKSGLYRVSQNETVEILKKLNESQEVQDVLQKCNQFHTIPKCNSTAKYRTIDGTCNNLKSPHWGSADSTSDRFVSASYNGVSGLRKSVSGEDLPNARNISINLENTDAPSNQVSAFFSYYGQILVHDITLGPGISRNGTIIPCCVENPDPNCIDIEVSPDDPFYNQFNLSCIPFARTAPYPQCNFDKRQQMNKKTAFLDVSLIYGSNDKEAQQMRANDSSGRLNTRQTPFGEILPHASSNKTLFCPANEIEKCFLSGDERVNQHTMVICVQTLLVRLHNTIHDKLFGLNPHWDNETLYQETRRIVVALQQNIVYQEYLPWLVGPESMKKYNLSVDAVSLYDEKTRPFLFIEFNTASFRLHSMLPKAVSTHYPEIRMSLTYSYFCPVYNGQLDAYITGSCEAPSEKYDRFVKVDVTDYLHRPPKASFGVDIAAINIQRGRDHGLSSYTDVVEKCSEGKTRIETFSDLLNRMSQDSVEFLKKIYTDVRDIDLWVGMTVEKPIEGGVTGPTATCISAIQFHRLKFGDSFFYTHENGRYPFTKDQLETIKSFSVARWLCDTTSYDEVRRHPFAVPGKNNPVTACQKIQPLDLSLWREKP
ncbi:salivary peroxidase/catechol oxidase [Parasteatoda tepidariorum]|uniref:salivary peroxidase/catechol oxidase n=1 Tax=Parasteatoda tepidariorum TaxID=114398 RepID=UPI0039BCD4A5